MIRKKFFTIDNDAGQIYCVARYSVNHRNDEKINITESTIICPPVGTDYNSSYHNLRAIGEQLALTGHLVIQLDYIGFGNSSEKKENVESLASMLASVHSVHSWLKEIGVSKINIIGLRFGATLAALSSNSLTVNKLVLWSPIVKGKSFIREIKMLSQASEQAVETSECHDISGWSIEPLTSKAISDIDLLTFSPSANHILIIQDGQKRQLQKLADHYAKENVDRVSISEQHELVSLLVDAHESQLAVESNQVILDFLGESTNNALSLSIDKLGVNPFCFGEDYRDSYFYNEYGFVIKTESLINQVNLPTLVFLNSGSNHQVGPHRLYVTLSRELAKQGFNSIRVDLPGLGETPAKSSNDSNKPYPENVVSTLSSLLKRLKLDNEPLIVVGLCSGAYHSLKFSAEADDFKIKESIIINPLTFYWQQGMIINDSPSVTFGHWNWYLKSMKDWRRWKKLFKGDVEIKPILNTIKQRFFAKPEKASRGKSSIADKSAWEIDMDLNRTLFKSNQRNIQQTFIFSDGDPGFSMLRVSAKKALRKLTKNKSLTIHHIGNADHTFSKHHARQRLIELLKTHLSTEYTDSKLKFKEST